MPAPTWRARRPRAARSTALLGATIAFGVAASGAHAASSPSTDPFYTYAGATPLSSIAPGTVLATRTKPYHVAGIPTPLKAIQLLYRTTTQTGKPTVNVTSVIKPPWKLGPTRLLSYQSAYDSLNPADERRRRSRETSRSAACSTRARAR